MRTTNDCLGLRLGDPDCPWLDCGRPNSANNALANDNRVALLVSEMAKQAPRKRAEVSEPIWVRKRIEKEDQIRQLIADLEALRTDNASVMAAALDYYGFNKGNLPHDSFVAMRKELIQKATSLIKESRNE